MNKASFLPVFEVGIVNNEMPACRQINTASLDPATTAGMCVSIIDFVISKIEDNKQIEYSKIDDFSNVEQAIKSIVLDETKFKNFYKFIIEMFGEKLLIFSDFLVIFISIF